MRTNSGAVEGILGDDWGGASLLPYIKTATVVVDRVQTLAIARNMALSSSELEILETWLAAHFYTQMDPAYTNKSTDGASAGFMGQSGKGFEASRYGQQALRIDWSGSLEAIDKRKIAKGAWLGTIPPNCGVVPSDSGPGTVPY